MTPGRRLLLVYGVVSLAAVALGAWVSAAHGVPAGSWIRNLAAWAVGGLAAAVMAAGLRPGAFKVALWLAPVGLAATLVSADQQGVHRWIDLGPLHVNMAMLLLPTAIVALAALATERLRAWIAAFLCLAVLDLQPDASQATTLAAAIALVAAMAPGRPGLRVAVAMAAAGLAAVAWLRPDPLQPVAEVEAALGLALSLSPLAAALAATLLVAIAATPAVTTQRDQPAARRAGAALGLCFLMWAAMPFAGAFPVPFLGIGMSAILGGWLGVGLLAGLIRIDGAGGKAA